MLAPLGPGYGPLDPRLAPFAAAALDPATAVLTVDCFDTLVWRRVAAPVAAFDLVATELGEAGLLRAVITPRDFRTLRAGAESRASDKARREGREANLVDIYNELPCWLMDQRDRERAASVEIDVERRVTVPNSRLADLLATLQGVRGLPLVVVSDIYMRGSDLERILDRPELRRVQLAAIVTSADAGTCKSAHLWQHLPGLLGVRPEAIVHLGDALLGDVVRPRAEGVRAFHYLQRTKSLHAHLVAEGWIAPDGQPAGGAGTEVDEGLAAVRSHATFRPEAAEIPVDLWPYWEIGASTLGPVLCGFSAWIHQRSVEIGARAALCVTREGTTLRRLVDGVAPTQHSMGRVEVLHASRRACTIAAIRRGSFDELEPLVGDRRISARPSVLLPALGLGPAECTHLMAGADDSPDRERALDLLRAVSAEAELREIVVAHARQQRQGLLDHVFAAAGVDSGVVALVDVGYAGTVQRLLQGILRDEGFDLRLVGLYLACFPQAACEMALGGNEMHGYLSEGAPTSPDLAAILCNVNPLELLLSSGSGTTVGWDAGGRPCEGAELVPQIQALERDLVQVGVRSFQSEWNARIATATGEGHRVPELDRAALRRLLARFLGAPDPAEVAAFVGWRHEDGIENGSDRALVDPEVVATVRSLPPEEARQYATARSDWVAGTLAAAARPPVG